MLQPLRVPWTTGSSHGADPSAPGPGAIETGVGGVRMDDETGARPGGSQGAGEARPGEQAPPTTVTYSASPDLAAWLARAGIALAVTSYQSGKLYLLGANPRGGLMVHERFFYKAMGVTQPRPGSLLLATLYQITRFEDVLEPGQHVNELHDACFVPRVSWTTGALDAHDVGLLADGRPVFVATAYNCLATIDERHSFAPHWRPPFISGLVREDRCHLNGLAMGERGTQGEGHPAYVTACSRSDTIDGWRDRRGDGGVVLEVATGRVVCSGLSMPHSPRLHDGRLYVLNSGTGELGWVDRAAEPAEAFRPVAFCPGFVRGLALHEGHAIVGLSKPRYERFEGLALDGELQARDSEPWCGVQVIDLSDGSVRHWFRIDGAVAELYDVAVVEGARCPMALGMGTPEAASEIAQLVTLPRTTDGERDG